MTSASIPRFGRGAARSEPELSGLSDAEVLERVRRGQMKRRSADQHRTLLQIVQANVFTPSMRCSACCSW
jgi:hypothetical protein